MRPILALAYFSTEGIMFNATNNFTTYTALVPIFLFDKKNPKKESWSRDREPGGVVGVSGLKSDRNTYDRSLKSRIL